MTRFPLRWSALVLLVIAATGCSFVLGGVPRQVFPANGSTLPCLGPDTDDTTGYVFRWSSVPNADGYVLEVYNTGTGALIAAVSITGSPPKTDHVFPETALDCGGITYRWRVGATFPNNAAPAFSGFWTFTIP